MEDNEFDVLIEVGQSYLLNRQYEEAIAKFTAALRLNPHEPDAYYYLGLAYEGSNKYAEAITMYRKTITIDPGYANAEIRINALADKIKK